MLFILANVTLSVTLFICFCVQMPPVHARLALTSPVESTTRALILYLQAVPSEEPPLLARMLVILKVQMVRTDLVLNL